MTVLVFIKDVIFNTFGQMASLFLGIFIFGLLIHFISRLTFRSLVNAFGPGGMYVVAWLGTPVHESGHALFCLVFGHKIDEMRFFQPDDSNGTLGYVRHRWDPRNPWHVLGNFFIGTGPVVLGSGVLFALFYFLIPDSAGVWDRVTANMDSIEAGASAWRYFTVFGDSLAAMAGRIFTSANPALWQFWVFLYLSICVASNISLSWADVKGSLSGLGCIVLPFLILNIVFLFIGHDNGRILPITASFLGFIYGLLTIALVMVLLGFVIIYVPSAVYYRLRYRSILNPFG